jgi:hypothetical protein
MWRTSRIDVRDPLAVSRLGDRVRALLRGPQRFARLPRTDAALVGLVAVAGMRTAISKELKREYADRIAEAIALGGPAVGALRRVLRQARSGIS